MLSIKDLPQDLQPIAEISGIEKAIKYALTVGGYPVYICHYDGTASTLNEDMREMIRHFGETTARKLFAALAGDTLLIPNCKGIVRARRNERIIAMQKGGAAVGSIARAYKLTTRMIYKVLAANREPKRTA